MLCVMPDDVLEQAAAFALQHAATPEQRGLFETAFSTLRTRLLFRGARPSQLDCVQIPGLVYAALRNGHAPAAPLSVSLVLWYMGVDLLDDLMDGDLPS